MKNLRIQTSLQQQQQQYNALFYPSPSSVIHEQCYQQDEWLLSYDQTQFYAASNTNDFYDLTQPCTAEPLFNTSIHHYMLQPTPLEQLSREQLIQRVVELETEISTKEYACLWNNCQEKAPTLEKLMKHICDAHVGSGKASYYCEWKDCARNQKPFMKRHKIHHHIRTHTGERPFHCTILGCKKKFSRPDSLTTHTRTHSNFRPYACSVPGCKKAYFHSRSLRKHVKSVHMNL